MASTNPDEDAAATIRQLSDLLGDLSDRMVLIGGVAFNYWRNPRYTHDVDFTAQADAALLETIRRRLEQAGFEVTREQAGRAPSGPDFLQFTNHRASPIRIVEFQTAKTDYQELVIERSHRLESMPFSVATPEDLIVLKLIASRHQDLADCVELGQVPGLDWDYIHHWSEVWGLCEAAKNLEEMAADEGRRLKEMRAEYNAAP